MRMKPILCYKRTERPDRTPIQRLVPKPVSLKPVSRQYQFKPVTGY